MSNFWRRFLIFFLKLFFDAENMKKRPQKLLIIGPQFFFMYWLDCPNGPETDIPYRQKPLNPIPTSQGRNQPLYERHVTKSGRNRVNTGLGI